MITDKIILQKICGFYIPGKIRQVTGSGSVTRAPFQGAPETTVSIDGFYAIGQMYIQNFKLLHPCYSLPIIFMHGGGMTGSVWETTPADQPGWHDYFMRAGFDTYLCDAVERGRSASPPPFLVKTEPIYRTIDQAWENFRFGPKNGYSTCQETAKIFPGLQFPVNYIDNLACYLVGRWIDAELDNYAQVAYNQLIDKAGPCILLAHSQGAGFALQAALDRPHLVRKVIAIEPSFCPELILDNYSSTDYLFLWGDNIYTSNYWQGTKHTLDNYCKKLTELGSSVCLCDLPQLGIKGNSHLMMMDKNNAEIASYILRWISS